MSVAPSISKQYADNLRRELRAGRTHRGQPLTDEQRRLHITKLKRRALALSIRFRRAELARIREFEGRSVGPHPMDADDLGAPNVTEVASSSSSSHSEAFVEEASGSSALTQKTPADDLYIMRYVGILQDVLKIGRSANPEQRRRSLESCQSFHVELVATFPGRGHLEHAVHKRLAECRCQRGPGTEWFQIGPQGALEAVAKSMIEYDCAHPAAPR